MSYSLNENIKRLRLGCGKNQVVFAKDIGVTKQCVSNWENGNVLPSIEMLMKIADVLGVTTDYLLGRCETATIDVSRLTDEQRGHVSLLVHDFIQCNETVSRIK